MSRPLKVVAVLPKIEYFSSQQGGALATWVHQVYRRIPSWDVKVVTIAADNLYSIPPTSICRVGKILDGLHSPIANRSLGRLLEPIKLWLRTGYNRRAADLCKSFKPDTIHIQNDYEAVLPIRKQNPHAHIILHMQNDHLTEAYDSQRAEEACHTADTIAFCSEYLQRNCLKTFPSIPESKTFVIFNGADEYSRHLPIRSFKDDPRLLFVGRIVTQKGLHILLEAIEDIFVRYPKATLRIVGGINFGSTEEDNYLRLLRTQASAWGDRIIFAGPIPHDRITAEFAQADLFVCPSVWNEPLGMVNAEAMACGLPIVAFARGGIPEVIGDAGILVREISAQALATAINTVLDDLDLRSRLSQRGIERVRTELNWQTISQAWIQQLQPPK